MRMNEGWGEKTLIDARTLWRQVVLATGGTQASMQQGCQQFKLGICNQVAGGELGCGCRHWWLIPAAKRAMLIACRAGMPAGLIAHNCGAYPTDVAAIVDVLTRLCEVQPALKSHAERITARVPMWGERIERRLAERSIHAVGV